MSPLVPPLHVALANFKESDPITNTASVVAFSSGAYTLKGATFTHQQALLRIEAEGLYTSGPAPASLSLIARLGGIAFAKATLVPEINRENSPWSFVAQVIPVLGGTAITSKWYREMFGAVSTGGIFGNPLGGGGGSSEALRAALDARGGPIVTTINAGAVAAAALNLAVDQVLDLAAQWSIASPTLIVKLTRGLVTRTNL